MTRVKICGLMNDRDVGICVDAGVHTLGFVVEYPVPVPWNLTCYEAKRLIDRVPPYVSTCVVTGGEPERVAEIAGRTRPSMLQLHYNETLEDISRIVDFLGVNGTKVVKALRIREDGQCDFEIGNVCEAAGILSRTGISAILVDSYTETMPGGTGVTVGLQAFMSVRDSSLVPVILAGGLDPDNVGSIIREAAPFAVDVLTGVEKQPGHKDEDKVRRFMRAAFSK